MAGFSLPLSPHPEGRGVRKLKNNLPRDLALAALISRDLPRVGPLG